MEENKSVEPESESLDGEELDNKATEVTATPEGGEIKIDDGGQQKTKLSAGGILGKVATRINVYLLIFMLMVVIALIIMFVVFQASNKEAEIEANVTAQELTQEAVENLTSNESTVGDPKQLLNIESNAVFAGKVLIRNGLDVAGPIKVGGDLSLPGITVSGKSQFDEVLLNSLSIAGDTNIRGILTVQKTISVTQGASFGGPISAPSLTVDALTLSGDIQFGRHIDAGGSTPSVSGGTATGSGGTVTISGTDTAGTVTINVGAGAAGGVLASVTFAVGFDGSPHVVITPIASIGSGPVSGTEKFFLSSRTNSGFSIATSGGLASGSISFDYVVID